jgi:hypothetical protein
MCPQVRGKFKFSQEIDYSNKHLLKLNELEVRS